MVSLPTILRSVLETHLEPTGREWLASALAAAARGDTSVTGTVTSRRIPPAPLRAEAHRSELSAVAPGVVFDSWTTTDATRALLLLALAESLPEDAFAAAATAWYEQADAGEQQSWLRALPLLPRSERFLPLAIDSCRTNIVPLFEAIACDNPYPERHFPTPQFNQLVLKTVFVGLPLVRVVGLSRRRNGELSRMASDFADERRAAGRPVPADLHLAITESSNAESRS